MCLFLRICTIFCMREATYISYGYRMRAGPQALKTPSKLKSPFRHLSPKFVFIILGSPWGYGSMVSQWGHENGATPPEDRWRH